jgi:peptidyl-prolyl cis-trans isomerase B (cyclophilin B)
MANTGQPGSNGSQFFFVYGTSQLQGNYSLWGHVITGLDIIKQVAAGGDNGEYAAQAGGGRPNTPLTFTKVTAGPITQTPAPTPAASTSSSPSATTSPAAS